MKKSFFKSLQLVVDPLQLEAQLAILLLNTVNFVNRSSGIHVALFQQ
jgi:hypothetical protein